MNNHSKKSLASILSDVFKIITCGGVIAVWVILIHFMYTNKIIEPQYKNTFRYNLCSYVAGDFVMKKAEDKALLISESLTQSVDSVLKGLQINIEDLGAIDIEQDNNQKNLSERIAYSNEIINDISKNKTAITGWIYAGAKYDETGEWGKKYFVFDGDAPVINHLYYTDLDLNIRMNAPSKESGVWQKGRIIGGLSKGDSFTVTNIAIIPGTGNRSLYWVRIIKS